MRWPIASAAANTLFSTIRDHMFSGPPVPSWNFPTHYVVRFLDTIIRHVGQDLKAVSRIRKSVDSLAAQAPIPRNTRILENVSIPQPYRNAARDICTHLGMYPVDAATAKDENDLMGEIVTFEHQPSAASVGLEQGFRRTVLYLHGGAYLFCSSKTHRPITTKIARYAESRVFALDYRLAPENSFPAPLEDALATYIFLSGLDYSNPKALLSSERHPVVIAGDSAGGGLAIALAIAIRNAGLPPPSGVIALSPWLDMTTSSPSWYHQEGLHHLHLGQNPPETSSFDYLPYAGGVEPLKEHILKELGRPSSHVHFYAGPESMLMSPYVSPLWAETYDDMPSMLLQFGSIERLRDECLLFAARLGQWEHPTLPFFLQLISSHTGKDVGESRVIASIDVEMYEGMPHVFQMFSFAAESKVAILRVCQWIKDNTHASLAGHDDSTVSASTLKRIKASQDGQAIVEDLDTIPIL